MEKGQESFVKRDCGWTSDLNKMTTVDTLESHYLFIYNYMEWWIACLFTTPQCWVQILVEAVSVKLTQLFNLFFKLVNKLVPGKTLGR